MTFLYFAVTTFALCYLAADARIFGADVTAWNEVYFGSEEVTDEDTEWLWGLGVLKVRQHLLWYDTIREHLGCYFCMGVWAGPAAHVILWTLFRLRAGQNVWTPDQYCLWHPNTLEGWAIGVLCAFLWGACSSYFINAVLHRIEGPHG